MKINDLIIVPDLGSCHIFSIDTNYKPGPKIYLKEYPNRWCTFINNQITNSHSYIEPVSVENLKRYDESLEIQSKSTYNLFRVDTYVNLEDFGLVKIISIDNIETIWYITKIQRHHVYSKEFVKWLRIKNSKIIIPPTNTICDTWFYKRENYDTRIVDKSNFSTIIDKDELLNLTKLNIKRRPVISIDIIQTVWFKCQNIVYWMRTKDCVPFTQPSKTHKWSNESSEEFINY